MSEEKKYIVYLIKNLVNDKIYIGRTSRDLKVRLYEHYGGATSGKQNTVFAKDIRKFRRYNFVEKILIECDVEKHSMIYEFLFIKAFKSIELGYNSKLDCNLSDEDIEQWKKTANKINKERLTGVAMTEANKKACSISHNKLFTDEEIEYIRYSDKSCETIGGEFGVSRHRAEYIRRTGTDKLTEARERGNGNKIYTVPTNTDWKFTILSDNEIEEIKESGETAKNLAETYKVSDKRIGFIKKNGF